MHTLASPCSGHVRLRKTFAGESPTRQTSAGHGPWHTGHRLVVCFSSSSVRGRTRGMRFGTILNSSKVHMKPAGEAPETTHANADHAEHHGQHDGEHDFEWCGLPQAPTEHRTAN